MSGTFIIFLIIASVAELVGVPMILVGVRGGIAKRPRNAILFIAGMMASAFGLILGGFTIAYNSAAPLDLNSAEAA